MLRMFFSEQLAHEIKICISEELFSELKLSEQRCGPDDDDDNTDDDVDDNDSL